MYCIWSSDALVSQEIFASKSSSSSFLNAVIPSIVSSCHSSSAVVNLLKAACTSLPTCQLRLYIKLSICWLYCSTWASHCFSWASSFNWVSFCISHNVVCASFKLSPIAWILVALVQGIHILPRYCQFCFKLSYCSWECLRVCCASIRDWALFIS